MNHKTTTQLGDVEYSQADVPRSAQQLGLILVLCLTLLGVACYNEIKQKSFDVYTLVIGPRDNLFVGYRFYLFTSLTGTAFPVISQEEQDTTTAASSSAYERLRVGQSYRLQLSEAPVTPRTHVWTPGQWPGRYCMVEYVVPPSSDTASLMLLREDSVLVTLYESPDIVGPFIRKKSSP